MLLKILKLNFLINRLKVLLIYEWTTHWLGHNVIPSLLVLMRLKSKSVVIVAIAIDPNLCVLLAARTSLSQWPKLLCSWWPKPFEGFVANPCFKLVAKA